MGTVVGPVAIVGACIAWGLDNNLTHKVSLSNPLQVVELKGLLLTHLTWSSVSRSARHGVNSALFVVALRRAT
jgi:hypothetical protein